MCRVFAKNLPLIFLFNLVCGRSDVAEYLARNVKMGQCRAACIDEFSTGLINSNYRRTNNYGCTTKTNWKCNMCWDYCEMLSINKTTRTQLCSDDICTDGCEYACRFFKENDQVGGDGVGEGKIEIFSPIVTRRRISWTYMSDMVSDEVAVYIIFGLRANNVWQLLGQTTDSRLEFEADVSKMKKITIVAVSKSTVLGLCSKQLVIRHKRQIH